MRPGSSGRRHRPPRKARDSAVLETAQGKALGTQTFQLLSVDAFQPGGHKGQKMEARGLLYKDTNYARLNPTSLQTLDASCQTRP